MTSYALRIVILLALVSAACRQAAPVPGATASNAAAEAYVPGLGESFDDVVKFHPTHEESPVAPKDAIPRMVTVPLMELGAAVTKKDTKVFEQAYDTLTKACNDCHQATNFGF